MKNYFFLPRIFFLLLTLVSFLACSEDDDAANDDDGSQSGNTTYNGANFNLTQGIISNFGEAEEGLYNFDITLLSDDLDIDFENEVVTGRGAIVYLEMWTAQSSQLKEGTYKLSNGEADFGITFAEFSPDYNFDIEDGNIQEATEAEVTLDRSGSIYLLEYTLIFPDGKTLTGTFEGDLYEVSED